LKSWRFVFLVLIIIVSDFYIPVCSVVMIEPDEGCVDIVDVPLLTNVDSAITIVVIVEIMMFCFFSL